MQNTSLPWYSFYRTIYTWGTKGDVNILFYWGHPFHISISIYMHIIVVVCKDIEDMRKEFQHSPVYTYMDYVG